MEHIWLGWGNSKNFENLLELEVIYSRPAIS